MSDIITREIEIPSDVDGFVLLQCPKCGEFFKLIPSEMEAEDVISIYCPFCGLVSEDYYTDDVITLANKIAKNIGTDLINDFLKDLETSFKNGPITFKSNTKIEKETETPIVSGIEAMVVQKYKCCKREAKIHPIVKISGSFCPYCGVRYDEY